MKNGQFRLSSPIQLSNWGLATLLSPECASGAISERERRPDKRKTTKKCPEPQVEFTCPFALEGDEATAASPGLSAAASPFAAVLENWAPMLASSTKKLNRSKRGNKEPWVGVTTGRAAAAAAAAATAAAAHTPEGGGGGGEEDRRDPIKYTPDKKILVEEIKKQQHRREGKRWKSRAQKRSPSVVFFSKKKKRSNKKIPDL